MIRIILSNADLFVFIDNFYSDDTERFVLDRKISFEMYVNLFIQSKI